MLSIEMGSQHGVYFKLDANEVSATELKKLATEALAEACRILKGEPVPPAGSAVTETRWIADHHDPNYNSKFGFAPPKAEGGPA